MDRRSSFAASGQASVDNTQAPSSVVPDEPWQERNWDKSCKVYNQLRQLYSGYFDCIHGAENEDALIDLVLCQLNCFVGIDVLMDKKLQLILVESFAQTRERHLCREEFICLMFYLSFASKEQLEEAVFNILSAGQSRVTVAQIVHMHSYKMQRRMTIDVINLISECDRSGCGLLDVYDFRLLIGKLQEMEQQACTQAQPPLEMERAKLEEALLEAHELQSWSWDIGDPHLRSSPQLRNLAQCRAMLGRNPDVAEVLSKLAWDFPEILSAKFAKLAIDHSNERHPSTTCGTSTVGSVDTVANDCIDDQASIKSPED